jgi:hypothetical protein
MQLSEDQKQRILDEESQRLAEEQYRAKVRLDLRNQTGTNSTPIAAPPEAAPRPIKGAKNYKGVLLLLIIPAVVAALWIVRSSTSDRSNEPYAPSVIVTKHAERIVSGQVTVGAGKIVFYKIPIQNMHDARVTGHFVAYGGSGNDIGTFIAEEKEFGEWLDGRPSKVRYQSGRVTTGDIDVKLPLLNATYYLCFNNKFSVLSAKTVDADVTLSYSTIVLK